MVLSVDSAETFTLAPPGQPEIDLRALWQVGDLDALAALRRRYFGYVLQSGGLLGFLTVHDNINLPRRWCNLPDDGTVAHLAERLGLSRLLNRYPSALSVGERQRVAIARALAHRPPMVLADEPTASLDPLNADSVMDLFLALATEQGTTVIVASHDWTRMERLDADGTLRLAADYPGTGVDFSTRGRASDRPLCTSRPMKVFGNIAHIAGRDYAHEWRLSLCAVLALAAVLAPLLVLLGLKHGVMSTLIERLAREPRNRELLPVGGHRFAPAWFTTLATRPEVAFVIPRTRQIAGTLDLRRPDLGRSLTVELLPTASGDPLLPVGVAPPSEPLQLLISQSAAEKLQLRVGDQLPAAVSRSHGSRLEYAPLTVTVSAVLPLAAGAAVDGVRAGRSLCPTRSAGSGGRLPGWFRGRTLRLAGTTGCN